MPTTQEITKIVNDPSLSDTEKAKLLGISNEEYADRNKRGEYAKLARSVPDRGTGSPRTQASGTGGKPRSDHGLNPDAIRSVVNDTNLTDDQKAEKLGISSGALAEHKQALDADPVTVLDGLRGAADAARASLDKHLTGEAGGPVFDVGGDPARQHQAMQDAEAAKLGNLTGKTRDGRRLFSVEEQQAYNQYGGPVPVKNIWDWADKLDAGVIEDYRTPEQIAAAKREPEFARQNA